MVLEIDGAHARRIALLAQGFLRARSARASSRAKILELVGAQLGVLQLDSVNVLCRAHYLPVFARLGAYQRAVLDACAWTRPSALFEYWGHQASLLPVAMHRLFRWRMQRAARGEGTWGRLARFAKEKRSYVRRVLAEIRDRGPLAASELTGAQRGPGGWWEWSDAKHAVEWLFWAGKLTASSRRNFERLYDLPERVLPSEALADAPPPLAVAHRELLEISGRALGIGTEDDLCDYFRLSRLEGRPRIAELVEEGILLPARVEGWPRAAFVHRDRQMIRPGDLREVTALLTPFDPLIWHRPRALRLFGFHYRIEIYTPPEKRKHGYYVLPFLLGDQLVARIDLKSDRAGGALAVRAAHHEPGTAPPNAIVAPLAAELQRMAAWLGLGRVSVEKKGSLATALRAAVE